MTSGRSSAVQGVVRSARRSAVPCPTRYTAPVGDQPASAAIADAKREWLEACVDGSSPDRVERLYGVYRDLVIRQAALAVQGSAVNAS
jgi:hypothetical protein